VIYLKSDVSDTDFIYILSANECQQRNNEEMTLAVVSAAIDRQTPTSKVPQGRQLQGANVPRNESSMGTKVLSADFSLPGTKVPGNEESRHHVTKAAGSEFFDQSQKNESALAGANRLVKDRSRKSGSIQNAP